MKKAILLFLFSAVVVTLFANQVDELVDYASRLMGSPYRHGAEGPRYFDCSGFTKHVFGKFGYTLNRTSASQYGNGTSVKRKNAQKGDLIFFKGSRVSSPSIGHVGIVVSEKGETPIRFVHASVSSGVCIDNLESDYYSRRFVGITRVIEEERRGGKADRDSIDAASPMPVAPADNIYVVKQGDTMYSISRQYGCSVADLQALNNMTDNNLRIGQMLKVAPDAESLAAVAPADTIVEKAPASVADTGMTSATEEPLSPEVITHIVKKGETLYRISKRYGVTPEQISVWNNLPNHIISIGQEIKILR